MSPATWIGILGLILTLVGQTVVFGMLIGSLRTQIQEHKQTYADDMRDVKAALGLDGSKGTFVPRAELELLKSSSHEDHLRYERDIKDLTDKIDREQRERVLKYWTPIKDNPNA